MPALLFDLDGTMIETDHLHERVFQEMLTELGAELEDDFYNRHIHGRMNAEIFAHFLPGRDDHDALSEAKETAFREALPKPYPSMPGLEALIALAQKEGWGMAVVTNAPRLNAKAMLNAIGFGDVFDHLVIGEECARGKPDPEPYLKGMQALNAQPQDCIAFEDSPSGLRAAARSGAYAVGIRSALGDTDLRNAGAAMSIQDFNDPALQEILQRHTGVPA